MKKYILLVVVMVVFFGITGVTFATSGACSWHGGVNCSSGSAIDGNAICNDGTESSVAYSNMIECHSICVPPGGYAYTDSSQCAALQEQQIRSGSEYTPEISSGNLQYCYNQVAQYQAAQLSYQTCLNSQSTYIPPVTLSPSVSCQIQFGAHSIPSTQEGYCSCGQGYQFDNNKQCVLKPVVVTPTAAPIIPVPPVDVDASCRSQYGVGSIASTTNALYCICNQGFYKDTNAPYQCVSITETQTHAAANPSPKKVVLPKKEIPSPVSTTVSAPTSTNTVSSTTPTISPQSNISVKNKSWYRKFIDYFMNLFK